jgi:hypothetical protein
MSEEYKRGEETTSYRRNMEMWLKDLYRPSLVNTEMLKDMYEEIRYQGFNRQNTLELIKAKFSDTKMAIKAILLCAVQGPQRASRAEVFNGSSLALMNIPAGLKPGSKGLSCGRITAATADLAAFHLKRLNVPKRIDMDCPAWLQFPSAGSISLPPNLREQHKNFALEFSKLIGGQFQSNIYEQMVLNSYYDPKLRLFE